MNFYAILELNSLKVLLNSYPKLLFLKWSDTQVTIFEIESFDAIFDFKPKIAFVELRIFIWCQT